MGRKLGIIGAGKVGEALASGIAQRGLVEPGDILLSDRSEAHRAELEARTGFRVDRGQPRGRPPLRHDHPLR